MKKHKHIVVEAPSNMTRREVRITNGLTNTLLKEWRMCIGCAIRAAIVITKNDVRHEHLDVMLSVCSETCGIALVKFLRAKGEMANVVPPPERAALH